MNSKEQQKEENVVEEETKPQTPKEMKEFSRNQHFRHMKLGSWGPLMKDLWDEYSSSDSSSDETIQVSKEEYQEFIAWKKVMEARRNFIKENKHKECCHIHPPFMMEPKPCFQQQHHHNLGKPIPPNFRLPYGCPGYWRR